MRFSQCIPTNFLSASQPIYENKASKGCLAGVQELECFSLKQGEKKEGKEINGEENSSITVK